MRIKTEKDFHLKMFECCIPVKGASRSVICDIQRNTYLHVPNTMVAFVEKYDGYKLDMIAAEFSEAQFPLLEQYIDFLISNEFAFLTKTPAYYPKISREFETPHRISNAIIDHDSMSSHDYPALLHQLDTLGCQALEFRFFDVVDLGILQYLMGICKSFSFRSVELLIKFDEQMISEFGDYHQLVEDHNQLNYIVIHSAPEHVAKVPEKLLLSAQQIHSESCCGNINPAGFNPNQKLFFESINFNNCLNKKISIDKRGEIKNCPGMKKGFGQAVSVRLDDVLNDAAFKALWGITKDQINVCKDCEFRYICVDCRAYQEDPVQGYGKPSKCKYDPYAGIWAQ